MRVEEVLVVASEDEYEKRDQERDTHGQEGHGERRLVTQTRVHDDRCKGVRHCEAERGTDTNEL